MSSVTSPGRTHKTRKQRERLRHCAVALYTGWEGWVGGRGRCFHTLAPLPLPRALRVLADNISDWSSSGDDLQVFRTRSVLQTRHLLASICMNKPVTVQSQPRQVLHTGPLWYPGQEPRPMGSASGPALGPPAESKSCTRPLT